MKKILLIVCLLVCLVAFGGCANNTDKDQFIKEQPDEYVEQGQQQEQNKEENELQEQEIKIKKFDNVKKIGDIEISEITIKLVDKRKCEVIANLKNASENFIDAINAEIKVFDESGNVMEIFGGMLPSLAPYETSNFTTYILKDITTAHDIEFSEVE